MRLARNLDLIVLLLALAIFLAAGLPLIGWAGGAVAWVAQRLIRDWLQGRAAASDDPRTVAGYMTGSMIGRGWMVGLGIFGVGMIDSDAGLAAAVLFLAVFTIYFSASFVTRPFEAERPKSPGAGRPGTGGTP